MGVSPIVVTFQIEGIFQFHGYERISKMCLNMFEPPALLSASPSLCFSAWKVKNTAFAMPAAHGTAMIGIISGSDVPAWTTCGFIHGKTWFTSIACYNGVTINLLHSLKLTYHLKIGHPKGNRSYSKGIHFAGANISGRLSPWNYAPTKNNGCKRKTWIGSIGESTH